MRLVNHLEKHMFSSPETYRCCQFIEKGSDDIGVHPLAKVAISGQDQVSSGSGLGTVKGKMPSTCRHVG